MPFEIVRNDLVCMQVDAVVNTANPNPVVGSGLDAHIHRSAGPELLAARQKIGKISVGKAAVTPGYRLPARYVIHTVGPVWRGGILGEERQLYSCYAASLALALEHGCASVAFPLISTGNYRFPKDRALSVAISAIREFLSEHEMQVSLVVFDRESFRLSEQRSREVSSYIDEHYVRQVIRQEYTPDPNGVPWAERPIRAEASRVYEEYAPTVSERPREAAPRAKAVRKSEALRPRRAPAVQSPSLDQLLRNLDAGFSETLLTLIDQSGRKDSHIYNRANVSRQHFSKIRKNPEYKPTKATAIAFAIALELDLAQTRDLIGRAGYALTSSSIFDVIVMYFIEHKIYDLYQINLALFEHDQNLLGQ